VVRAIGGLRADVPQSNKPEINSVFPNLICAKKKKIVRNNIVSTE